jgi:hypothetical protein
VDAPPLAATTYLVLVVVMVVVSERINANANVHLPCHMTAKLNFLHENKMKYE